MPSQDICGARTHQKEEAVDNDKNLHDRISRDTVGLGPWQVRAGHIVGLVAFVERLLVRGRHDAAGDWG